MNNFNKYGSAQERKAVEEWLNNNQEINNLIKDISTDSKVGHDCILALKDGKKILVEVKHEESFWYGKTGNITLDAISAFNFNDESKNIYSNNWVQIDQYEQFKESVTISRMGSIYTSDADFMLKKIMDTDFIKLYDMKAIQNNVANIRKTHPLRINNKERYGINEEWKSATYCVKPDSLSEYEVLCADDFLRIINRNRGIQ